MPDSDPTWVGRNPVSIRFGPDSLGYLSEIASPSPVLLVTTPGSTARGLTRRLVALLGHCQVIVVDDVRSNPDLVYVEKKITALSAHPFDLVVAAGGGSAIDTAKLLAFGLAHRDPLRSWLDRPVPSGGCMPPVIAIPTTAGTGSEVTPFATVWDRDRGLKRSLSGQVLYPTHALLDPRLTRTVPLEVTIATGLDALSQGLESVWNRNATPLSLIHATEAVRLTLATLPRLARDLHRLPLRRDMMLGSLMSGLAISQTRTALAHSISYPLTASLGIPHGLACGFTLPALWRFNLSADDGRMERLAQTLRFSTPAALGDALDDLLIQLRVHRWLRAYVGSFEELSALAQGMLTPSRAENNLRQTDLPQVVALLAEAWNQGGAEDAGGPPPAA